MLRLSRSIRYILPLFFFLNHMHILYIIVLSYKKNHFFFGGGGAQIYKKKYTLQNRISVYTYSNSFTVAQYCNVKNSNRILK